VRTDRVKSSAQSDDGVRGDPRRASAELGQLGVELIVARTVDAIRRAAAHH
jgi:creatinine amidohydrolase/Fe(II)-dependent formamide hydrolase-like protein